MIKKALFTVIALGLTTVVLFGRDAASYVATTYHRLTSSVKDSVPIEFQIDRAAAMVQRPAAGNPPLDARDRQGRSGARATQHADRRLGSKGRQGQGRNPATAGRPRSEPATSIATPAGTYTPDQVQARLGRRFSRFKVADETLAKLKSMRDARERNLDAAQQKLAAMINARRKLEVDIQNLEAKSKLVEVAQASSDYMFDDSQLARAKELITDIRTQLDVAAKLANADVNIEVEIPLDEASPSDITDQVAEYFGLGMARSRTLRNAYARCAGQS